MNKRIKELRNFLHLSQKEFGEQIGVSRDVIANIENERATPSEPLIRLICRQFSADYFWLTEGTGEMIHVSQNPMADRIDDLIDGDNETAKAVLKTFAYFTDDDWKMFERFIDLVHNNLHIDK